MPAFSILKNYSIKETVQAMGLILYPLLNLIFSHQSVFKIPEIVISNGSHMRDHGEETWV